MVQYVHDTRIFFRNGSLARCAVAGRFASPRAYFAVEARRPSAVNYFAVYEFSDKEVAIMESQRSSGPVVFVDLGPYGTAKLATDAHLGLPHVYHTQRHLFVRELADDEVVHRAPVIIAGVENFDPAVQ